MLRRIKPALQAAALVLAASHAACDDPLDVQTEAPLDVAALGPGIHPVLVAPGTDFRPARPDQGDTVTIAIHLEQVEVPGKIASYQGELRYRTKSLLFVGGQAPPGVLAAWNENEAGVVRFAGVSVDGFEKGPVLLLHFERTARVSEDAFTLRIEEVVAQGSLEDLTGRVVRRDKPLLSRVPLP